MPSHALYDDIGQGYNRFRQPDPRIRAMIQEPVRGRCLNVGAGAGSYEPDGAIACELSYTMIAQRPRNAAPVVQASATRLPFSDNAFDTSVALLTLHHWDDLTTGVNEMNRVSRDRVVVFTFDNAVHGFWLTDEYFPAISANDRAALHYETLVQLLSPCTIITVPIPYDCKDGFLAAYWQRPHAYLDPEVRNAISAFHKLTDDEIKDGLSRLENDLKSGAWQERHGSLMREHTQDYGYRLLIATQEYEL
ncbi:MAG: class I SAM-dependent methyltransferase [Pseudomonadota bacterium]